MYSLSDCGGIIICASVCYCRSRNCRICTLSWHQIRNCCNWGLGTRYHADHVNLDKRPLVSYGGGLRFSVWVVVMDLGMLGLIYRSVRARNVDPGVSGRDVALDASIWRTGPWFLVTVAWSHGVWVVVVDIGLLVLMLVWIG